MQLTDTDLLRTQAFVNGEWIDGDGGETTPVLNPANGNSVAEVARCGTAETHRAIAAAAVAQEEWRERALITIRSEFVSVNFMPWPWRIWMATD